MFILTLAVVPGSGDEGEGDNNGDGGSEAVQNEETGSCDDGRAVVAVAAAPKLLKRRRVRETNTRVYFGGSIYCDIWDTVSVNNRNETEMLFGYYLVFGGRRRWTGIFHKHWRVFDSLESECGNFHETAIESGYLWNGWQLTG